MIKDTGEMIPSFPQLIHMCRPAQIQEIIVDQLHPLTLCLYTTFSEISSLLAPYMELLKMCYFQSLSLKEFKVL